MEPWNMTSVLEWLKNKGSGAIVIRMQGTPLKVVGTGLGVDQIDACSTDITEMEMDVGQEGIYISMSVHEHTLAIHFLLRDPKSKATVISMPVSIPFSLLVLTTEEEERARLKALRGEKDEPEYSPYELLHN